MILVDSTVLIDILRGRKGIKDVLKKYPEVNFGISAITLEEIYAGLGYSKNRLSETTYKMMVEKHEELLRQYTILSIDKNILIKGGMFRGFCQSNGVTIDTPDAIIAMTAEVMKVEKLITRNEDHFKFLQIPIESYQN